MADAEISALANLASLTATDQFEVASAAANYSLLYSTLVSELAASLAGSFDAAGAAAAVQSNLTTHIGDTGNPHAVTFGQVGADPAGTDNSTDVTLAGTLDYLTIVGQVITRNAIDITTDLTPALGTNVATALGINVGLSGAFVTQDGVLGTPSSGTLTSCTGLPIVGGTTGTLSIARGGTGNTTQQAAIDALTAVSGATTGHVLTKDGSGNATFQAAAGGLAIGNAISGGTANRVLYESTLNQLAESPNFGFNGTNLQVGPTAASNVLHVSGTSFQIARFERTTPGGAAVGLFENGADYWGQFGLWNDNTFSIWNAASGAAGSIRAVNVTSGGDVGINKAVPTAGSTLHVEATATSREKIMKGTVSDSGMDAFYVGNLTSVAATFVPAFAGYLDSINSRGSLTFLGFVSSANDASDSSADGIISLQAYRTNNAGDPLVGTWSQIQNRRIFSMRSNDEYYQTIDHNGRYWIGHASAYDAADDQVHMETESTDGWAVLKLEQKDIDQEFIDLTGTSAANAANSLTSWTAGNTIQGFFRIEVNGTDRWVPFYDAPTS